jgi:hypothetical protein
VFAKSSLVLCGTCDIGTEKETLSSVGQVAAYGGMVMKSSVAETAGATSGEIVLGNADDIIKSGVVSNLGKRIGNVAVGITTAKGVGLGLGVASGVSNIYEACNVNGSGNCGQTTTREVDGFLGGWIGGGLAEMLCMCVNVHCIMFSMGA